MKLPQTFISERDLEEKTEDLKNGIIFKRPENIPSKISTIEDAVKYLSNSTIPVYGYDKKKRLQAVEITLKEAVVREIFLGSVDLLDEDPMNYQGLYFNCGQNKKELKLNMNFVLDNLNSTDKMINLLAEECKKIVHNQKNQAWSLRSIPIKDDFTNIQDRCTKTKVDTPKEILWVFETFKEFSPVIHGGALRDLYLGIERTADIDVQLTTDGWWSERRLYSLIHKVMDEVDSAKKGSTTKDFYRGEKIVDAARYRAKKAGIHYDIAGEAFTRYLSTEQIMMKEPEELIMWELAKIDLDNKQFRVINSNDLPPRISGKIAKLRNLGLEFLPENPSNLSEEIF